MKCSFDIRHPGELKSRRVSVHIRLIDVPAFISFFLYHERTVCDWSNLQMESEAAA